MPLKLLRGVVVAAFLLPAGQTLAQGLTEEQLITGLRGPETLAVAIDPKALAAEVQANVGKGAASLPSWKQLSKLTQLAVDINFQYNSVAMVPELLPDDRAHRRRAPSSSAARLQIPHCRPHRFKGRRQLQPRPQPEARPGHQGSADDDVRDCARPAVCGRRRRGTSVRRRESGSGRQPARSVDQYRPGRVAAKRR